MLTKRLFVSVEKVVRYSVILFLFSFYIANFSAAMEKPKDGEIDKYIQDGSFEKRMEFARELKNNEVHPDLITRKKAELKAQSEGKTFDKKSFPYTTGLPSFGSPNVFVLLIEFPDHAHVNGQADIQSKLFGDGNAADYPYDSLRKFYQRASYNNLNIQGTAFQWYTAANNRSYYTDSKTLIKEALAALDPSYDFSIYDNNGDGKIDYFAVIWAGPNEGWSSLWWAWCNISGSHFSGDPFSVDGKTLGVYSWQFEAGTVGDTFSPGTIMHESGHALGLPDYYDYDCCDGDGVNKGTNNGVGGLDMMDANYGDHNAFSKYLLGWVTPTVVSDKDVIHKIGLRPSSSYPDAVMIMPNASLLNPFSEYFIVQNRTRTGNDEDYPNDGLLIWHVCANLNSSNTNFLYDNSYTNVKILKLMQADGLDQIENWQAANAGDYYNAGSSFSRSSVPTSDSYFYHSGYETGVYVTAIQSLWNFRQAIYVNDTNDYFSNLKLALDNNDLNFFTGGDSIWYGLKIPNYAFNENAARSALLSNNESTWIQANTEQQGILSFYWKTSSEANHDYLKFYLDGVVKDQISGEYDWEEKSYSISKTGTHYFKWLFQRDVSGDGGENRGYLDYVLFTPYAITLPEAVDNTSLVWTAGGNSGWFGISQASYYGGDAAKSDVISDNQNAYMSTELSGPGTFSFKWKVLSEANYDFLSLYVDGTLIEKISGLTDFVQKSMFIKGSGKHYVMFKYSKDISGKASSDCGFIDKVEFSPAPDLAEAVDNISLTWTTGGSGSWFYQNNTAYYGGDSAQSAPISDGQTTYLETTINDPGFLSFYWKTSSEDSYDYLELYVDDVMKQRISGEHDWSKTSVYISDPATVRWKYTKNASGKAGSDCGWVDRVSFSTSISIGQALDDSNFDWRTGNSLDWFWQNSVYYYGNDALQCGPHAGTGYEKQTGSLYASISGPGDLSFWWKVSSEGTYAPLSLFIDGVIYDKIGGEVDWQNKVVSIPYGTHNLEWRYDTYGDTYGGCVDKAWLDKVEYFQTVSIPEAVDNSLLTFSTYSDGWWYGQLNTSYSGGDAAQTGDISDNQWSMLETYITGPATVKFHWKVSSEANKDELEFYIDDVFKKQISGEVAWTQESFLLGAGSHKFLWWYVKDASGSSGSDAGWIDNIIIESTPSVPEAVDNFTITLNSDGNSPWIGQTSTYYSGGDAAQSGPITHNQYSRLYATITGPGILTFYWKVSSQGYWDWYEFKLDGATRNKISGNVDWQQRTYIIPDGAHNIEWKYSKDNAFTDYSDCGWLDKLEYTPGVVPPCNITVPTDFPTIQEAINNAREECIITVLPGTYYENIVINDKNIVLTSSDPHDRSIVQSTIIDGADVGSVVKFSGTEYSTCKLTGFTLINGRAETGGGIFGNYTLATIEDNIITSNTVTVAGGGIHRVNGLVNRNEVYHNYSGLIGGGIFQSNGQVSNNLVYSNSTATQGGGVSWCYGSVLNNTVYGNSAGVEGAGMFHCTNTVRNNIVWNNYSPSNPEVDSSITPEYCCIKNWTGGGTGNITTDPVFVDIPTIILPIKKEFAKQFYKYNFHIRGTSQCVDAGGAVTGVTDDIDFEARPYNASRVPRGDGSDYDIGADEYRNTVPSMQVLTPSQSAEFAFSAYTITWTDSDPDVDCAIALYYDDDNSGNNGTMIINNISENDPDNKYTWDISSVNEGIYYVYGRISDGANNDVYVYSPGTVKISRVTKDDLINHLLKKAPLPTARMTFADYNSDGKVDISDLIYLLNL